jgi:hypothetical protein
MISIEQTQELRKLFEPLYEYMPYSTHRPPWAYHNGDIWTRRALPIARSILGETVEWVVYDSEALKKDKTELTLPGGYHSYLVDFAEEDPTILCGTYQQFAFPPRPGSEHVLIAPASQTPQPLLRANVGMDALPYWRPDLYFGVAIRPA